MPAPRFIISGPGLEGKAAPSIGAAFAVAVDRAARLEQPGSFYVRDAGVIVGRADTNGDGSAWLWRPGAGYEELELDDAGEEPAGQLELAGVI